MPDGENICVGCKHPIVDETIEGDMALADGYTEIDFKKLAVGEDSGCRNCAVILDAIVTFVEGEGRSFMPSHTCVGYDSERQDLTIEIESSKWIEVIRYSGMSEHYTATLELRVHKILHAITSLPCLVSGTSKNPDRFREILLRKKPFV